jgi:hypothetical protein
VVSTSARVTQGELFVHPRPFNRHPFLCFAVINTANGKRIAVEAVISDATKQKPLITIVSTFFVVGVYNDTQRTFVLSEELPTRLTLRQQKVVGLWWNASGWIP